MYTTRLDIEVDLFRSQAGDFLALEVPNWMSLFIACGWTTLEHCHIVVFFFMLLQTFLQGEASEEGYSGYYSDDMMEELWCKAFYGAPSAEDASGVLQV